LRVSEQDFIFSSDGWRGTGTITFQRRTPPAPSPSSAPDNGPSQFSLTKGNLSSRLSKLEDARYIEIVKSFRGKVPHTLVRLALRGRAAFEQYRAQLKSITNTLETR
jgi:hypothetical protein